MPPTTIHAFDEAIALSAQGDGQFLGHTSPAYANMIGPYGGITAAQTLNAVMQHPDRLGEPVALTVNFAAALADGPFVVIARAARTNRSTQHWIVEVQQQGQTVITATVFTALRRDTYASTEHSKPDVPAPADVPLSTRKAPIEWLNRYETRFIEGEVPVQWDDADHGISRTRLWVRDLPARPLDATSLVALADVFFPRIWRRRARQVPVGTVSMTVYLHASTAQMQATGSGYLLAQSQAQAFSRGYFDQTAQLWNEAGELMVTTHQVVYFKE